MEGGREGGRERHSKERVGDLSVSLSVCRLVVSLLYI